MLYSCSNDKTIKIWSLKRNTGNLTSVEGKPILVSTIREHGDYVNDILVEDGQMDTMYPMLYSASADKTVKVFDTSVLDKASSADAGSHEVAWKAVCSLSGHSKGVWSLAAYNGRLLSADWNGEVKVWM
jgi:WD40 repeat protein